MALDDALCLSATSDVAAGALGQVDELWVPGMGGGEPSAYGVEVYTAGDCWLLAWHVAAVLAEQGRHARIMTLGWPQWEHVVVRVAPGLYLDATGLASRSDLERSWGRRVRVVPGSHAVSFGAFRWGLDAGVVYEFGHVEARAFAERLVGRWVITAAGNDLRPVIAA